MTLSLSPIRADQRWFFLLILPGLVAIEWLIAQSFPWGTGRVNEMVVLFDLILFVPLLYFVIYRSSVALRPRAIRTLGLVGLGILCASFIVPEDDQRILSLLQQFRNAALVLVVLFELWVATKLLKLVFAKDADAKQLENDFGVPPLVAKLMLLEARFWKAVWRMMRRR